ncbi:MAG: type II secretion system protein J, partial [Bacteriovoracia bacterium]
MFTRPHARTGFTLLEATVATGVLGILSLVLANVSQNANKISVRAMRTSDFDGAIGLIRQAVTDGVGCRNLFANSLQVGGTPEIFFTPNAAGAAIDALRLNNQVYMQRGQPVPGLTVRDIRLVGRTDLGDTSVTVTVAGVPRTISARRWVSSLRVSAAEDRSTAQARSLASTGSGTRQAEIGVLVTSARSNSFGIPEGRVLECSAQGSAQDVCENQLGGRYDPGQSPSCMLDQVNVTDDFAYRNDMQNRLAVDGAPLLHKGIAAEGDLVLGHVGNSGARRWMHFGLRTPRPMAGSSYYNFIGVGMPWYAGDPANTSSSLQLGLMDNSVVAPPAASSGLNVDAVLGVVGKSSSRLRLQQTFSGITGPALDRVTAGVATPAACASAGHNPASDSCAGLVSIGSFGPNGTITGSSVDLDVAGKITISRANSAFPSTPADYGAAIRVEAARPLPQTNPLTPVGDIRGLLLTRNEDLGIDSAYIGLRNRPATEVQAGTPVGPDRNDLVLIVGDNDGRGTEESDGRGPDEIRLFSKHHSAPLNELATFSPKGGIGVGPTAANLMTINGSVRIVDGNQGAGKVLVSDAAGKGAWQPSP